jgi:hypothetical protein
MESVPKGGDVILEQTHRGINHSIAWQSVDKRSGQANSFPDDLWN